MAMQKIALFNAQEFEIEYSNFDIVVYIIFITKMYLTEWKTEFEILVIFFKYSNLAYVFSRNAANTLLKYKNYVLCLETIGISLFRLLYNFFYNEFKIH